MGCTFTKKNLAGTCWAEEREKHPMSRNAAIKVTDEVQALGKRGNVLQNRTPVYLIG